MSSGVYFFLSKSSWRSLPLLSGTHSSAEVGDFGRVTVDLEADEEKGWPSHSLWRCPEVDGPWPRHSVEKILNNKQSIFQAFQNAHVDLNPIWNYDSNLFFSIPQNTAHHQITVSPEDQNLTAYCVAIAYQTLEIINWQQSNVFFGMRLLLWTPSTTCGCTSTTIG